MKKFLIFLTAIFSMFMIAGCSNPGGSGGDYHDKDVCRVEILINDDFYETIHVPYGERVNRREVEDIARDFKPNFVIVDIPFDFNEKITHDTEIHVYMEPKGEGDKDVYYVQIIINDEKVHGMKVKAGDRVDEGMVVEIAKKYRPDYEIVDILFDFNERIYHDTKIVIIMDPDGSVDKDESNVKLMANGKLIEDFMVPNGTRLDEEKFISMLPEFKNYTFEGFDYNFDEPIYGNRIIHAIYTLNIPASKKCLVEVYVLGDLWAQFEIERGGYIKPSMISIPKIDGYKFEGFDFAFDKPVEGGNLVIEAKMVEYGGFEPEKGYRVLIDFGPEFEPFELIVEPGDTIPLPDIPYNPGYELVGFEYNGKLLTIPFNFKVEDDMKLIAKWRKTTGEFTLTIDNGFEVKTIPYDKGMKLELIRPSRKGYRFDGYFVDGDPEQPVYLDDWYKWDKDITIVAKWTEVEDKVLNIKYELNGGEEPYNLPSQIQAGEYLELPDLITKEEDLMFVGWYSDSNYETSIKNLNELTKDATLYAKFINLREIKITYELNGGVNDPNNADNLRETYGSLYDPTHPENRRFGGWYLDPDFKTEKVKHFNFDDKRFHESFTLYACWLDKPNKVTVDTGIEGEKPMVYDVWFGETLNIHEPYRDGYEFTGYTYNGEIINLYEPFKYHEDITIVATWKPRTYTITYYVDGQSFTEIGDNKISYTFGDEFDLIPLKVVGKEFLGFYLDSRYSEKIEKIDKTRTGDLSIHIRFSKGKAKIVYNLDGGVNHMDNPSELELDDWFEPKSPTKEGYEFAGWYLEDGERFINGTIIGNLSLTAKWHAQEYMITIMGEDTIYVTYGEKYELDTITKEGYEFLGYTYYGKEFPQTGIYEYPNDITVVPNLKAIEYKINYIVPEGTVLNDRFPRSYTVSTGGIYLNSNPVHESKSFAGWYTDSNYREQITYIDTNQCKDITLYAKFADVVYTITFDNKTVSGITSMNVVYGEAFKLPDAVAYEGLHFVSWYLNGTAFNCETYPYHEDINLSAHFDSNHRTNITYELNGGTNSEKNLAFYDLDYINLYPATKKGYKFKGWSLDGHSTSVLINSIDNPEDSYTLYAIFEREYYNINIYSDGVYEQSVVTSFENKYDINRANVGKRGYKIIGYTYNGEDIAAEGEYPYDHSINVDVKYEVITYKIHYEYMTGLENPNPNTFTINDYIKLKPIEKEGYRFVGFKYRYEVNGEDIGYIYEINHLYEDIYLTPTFDFTEYKINYVGDVEGLKFENYTYNITDIFSYVITNPTEGYEYEFYENGEKVTAIQAKSTGDKEITVKKIKKIYNLTINFKDYNDPNATFEKKVIQVAYTDEFDLTDQIPEGYKFIKNVGDFDNLKNNYFATNDTSVTISIQKICYYVEVNKEKDDLEIPKYWEYGDVIVLPDDYKPHYKFVGWFDEEGNQVTELKNLTKNITITSRFTRFYTTVVVDYGTRLGVKEYRVSSNEGLILYPVSIQGEQFLGYLNTLTNEYLKVDDYYNFYRINPESKLNLKAVFEEDNNIKILNRDGLALETIKAKINEKINLKPYWPKEGENEKFVGFEYIYNNETIRVLDNMVVPARMDFELRPVFITIGADFEYTEVYREVDGASECAGIRITKWTDTSAKEIIIPDTYNSYRIVEIAPGAFDLTSATKLVLGRYIDHLEARTFYNAANLKHIVMNAQITDADITDVQFNELHSIELFTKINLRKFSDNFKKVNLGNGNIQEEVKVILNYTPDMADDLSQAIFGGLTTTKILLETKKFVRLTGTMWLGRLANIISYKPDASLVEIELGGLSHNVALHLESIDDLLKIKRSYDTDYDKSQIPYVYVDGKPVKDIYVKEGTSRIPEGAYANIRYDNLIIPTSVTQIGAEAFSVVLGANIYIPDNIEPLGKKHLFTQSSVKVFFAGSEEKWNSLYTKNQGVDGYTITFDTPYLYEYNDGSFKYNYYVDRGGVSHIYDLTILNTAKEIVDLREFGEKKLIHTISTQLANYVACKNLKAVVLPASVKGVRYDQDFLDPDQHILVVATATNGLNILTSNSSPKEFNSFYTNVTEVSKLDKIEFIKNDKYEYILINDSDAHIFAVKNAAYTNASIDFNNDTEFMNKYVLTIQPGVFKDVTAKEIILPNNMRNISSNLFNGAKLSKVVFGVGTKYVEEFALEAATIDTLVLNKGLKSLASYANGGSSERMSHINRLEVPSITDYLSIYIPASDQTNFFYPENPNEEIVVDGKKVTNFVIEHQLQKPLDIYGHLCHYEGLKSLTIKSPVSFNNYWYNDIKIEAYYFDTLADLAKVRFNYYTSGNLFAGDNADAKIYVAGELLTSIHLNGTENYESDILKNYKYLTDVYIDTPHLNNLNLGNLEANIHFKSLDDLLAMEHNDFDDLYYNKNVYINENGIDKLVEEITIPANIDYIPSKAFANIKTLRKVNHNAKLTEIGPNAFYGCEALTSFDFTGVMTVGAEAFSNSGLTSLDLATVERIGKKAFSYTNLSTVHINNNISMKEFAFGYNPKLRSVIYGDKVTQVNLNAFTCNYISYIYIGALVESIRFNPSDFNNDYTRGYYSLVNDQNSYIEVSEQNKYLRTTTDDGNYLHGVFNKELTEAYVALNETYIPKTVTSIDTSPTQTDRFVFYYEGSSMDYDNVWKPGNNKDNVRVKTNILPANCYRIVNNGIVYRGKIEANKFTIEGIYLAYDANNSYNLNDLGSFRNWNNSQYSNLRLTPIRGLNSGGVELYPNKYTEEIIFPEGIEIIGMTNNLDSLNKVTLPSTLKTIGHHAFIYARNLKSIVIPASVKAIEEFAFSDTGITSLSLPNSLETLDLDALPDGFKTLSFKNISDMLNTGLKYSYKKESFEVLIGGKKLTSLNINSNMHNTNTITILGDYESVIVDRSVNILHAYGNIDRLFAENSAFSVQKGFANNISRGRNISNIHFVDNENYSYYVGTDRIVTELFYKQYTSNIFNPYADLLDKEVTIESIAPNGLDAVKDITIFGALQIRYDNQAVRNAISELRDRLGDIKYDLSELEPAKSIELIENADYRYVLRTYNDLGVYKQKAHYVELINPNKTFYNIIADFDNIEIDSYSLNTEMATGAKVIYTDGYVEKLPKNAVNFIKPDYAEDKVQGRHYYYSVINTISEVSDENFDYIIINNDKMYLTNLNNKNLKRFEFKELYPNKTLLGMHDGLFSNVSMDYVNMPKGMELLGYDLIKGSTFNELIIDVNPNKNFNSFADALEIKVLEANNSIDLSTLIINTKEFRTAEAGEYDLYNSDTLTKITAHPGSSFTNAKLASLKSFEGEVECLDELLTNNPQIDNIHLTTFKVDNYNRVHGMNVNYVYVEPALTDIYGILLYYPNVEVIELSSNTNTLNYNSISAGLGKLKFVIHANDKVEINGNYKIPAYMVLGETFKSIEEKTNETYKYTVLNDKYVYITEVLDKALTKVDLRSIDGKQVVAIGKKVFRGLDLESINLGENLEVIGASAFADIKKPIDIVLPDTLKMLGEGAFNKTLIKTISFGSSIETFDAFAITKIDHLIFRHPNIKINEGAFDSQVEIGLVSGDTEAIKELLTHTRRAEFNQGEIIGCLNEQMAGYSRNYLEEVIIGPNIKTIGELAFHGANGLKKIVIPDTVLTIEKNAFYDSALEEVVLPKSITEIKAGTFRSTNLKSIVIPGNVKKIGDYAFEYADKLTNIVFEEGLLEIGNETFKDTQSLKLVTLPKSLTKLGSENFRNQYGSHARIINVQSNFEYYYLSPVYLGVLEGVDFDMTNVYQYTEVFDGIITSYERVSDEKYDYELLNGHIALNLETNKCYLKNIDLVNDLKDIEVRSLGSRPFDNVVKTDSLRLPASLKDFSPYDIFNLAFDNLYLESEELYNKLYVEHSLGYNYAHHHYNLYLNDKPVTEMTVVSGKEDYGIIAYINTVKKVTLDGKIKDINTSPILTELPNLTEIVIPEGITGVNDSLFNNLPSLKVLRYPESLRVVPHIREFADDNEHMIIIPKTVEKIETENHHNTYYEGSIDDLKKVWDISKYYKVTPVNEKITEFKNVNDGEFSFTLINNKLVYNLDIVNQKHRDFDFAKSYPDYILREINISNNYDRYLQYDKFIIPETVEMINIPDANGKVIINNYCIESFAAYLSSIVTIFAKADHIFIEGKEFTGRILNIDLPNAKENITIRSNTLNIFPSLSEVNINSEKVTTLEKEIYSFNSYKMIINISKFVTKIEGTPVLLRSSNQIIIDPENKVYYGNGDYIMEKYVIPDGTILNRLICIASHQPMPNNVDILGKRVVTGSEIYLTKSIKYIEPNALDYYSTIYYEGTKEEFSKIIFLDSNESDLYNVIYNRAHPGANK